MSASRLQHARPIPQKSLTLVARVLAISCLSLPALAQRSDSQSALPNAPSASTTTVVVPAASSNLDHSLTFGERARVYAHSVFSYETVIGPAFGSAIGQWEDEPPGWGEGADGYFKRFGSGVARHEIAETIRFGFAAVDHEDPRYFRSEDRGLWPRARHAVISTFVSQTSSGATIPAFSRFAGTYSAAFISNTWYPANRSGWGDAARRGSTALASSIGFHLLSEFLPFGGDGR